MVTSNVREILVKLLRSDYLTFLKEPNQVVDWLQLMRFLKKKGNNLTGIFSALIGMVPSFVDFIVEDTTKSLTGNPIIPRSRIIIS